MTKPLQVLMDESELERLECWADERGCTKSQAVRLAIRALIGGRDEDPLLAASGMIEGLPSELAGGIDRHLAETFVAEKAPPYGGTRRRRPPVRR